VAVRSAEEASSPFEGADADDIDADDLEKRGDASSTQHGLRPVPTRDLNARVQSLLRNADSAPDGAGNTALFFAACRFGEMIVEGCMTEWIAEFHLKGAAWRNKLPMDKSLRTIASGLKTGMANARYWLQKDREAEPPSQQEKVDD
jgi:hypothetical protein